MISASTKRRPSAAALQRRLTVAKDAEIQRLRAAMVHAMDDCEALLQWSGVGARERAAIRTIASTLKAALEKK